MASPSPVQQLIQMMLGLREIAVREEQARIQGDVAAVDMLSRVGEMASAGLDPGAILNNSAEWASRLDISEDALRNFIESRVRSVESVRGQLVAEGAGAVPATEVAAAGLTGQSQGALAGSQLQGALATGAQELLADPNVANPAFQQFLQFGVNRQTPGQAALDSALANLGEDELMRGARIGVGTQMGAVEADASQRGWQGLRLTGRQLDLDAERLDLTRALEEAELRMKKTGLDAETAKQVDVLIAERNQVLEWQGQKGITPSPEGLAGSNEAYNLINARLRALLPGINLIDRPIDSPARALGRFENPDRR